jgi:hypothetical protein
MEENGPIEVTDNYMSRPRALLLAQALREEQQANE